MYHFASLMLYNCVCFFYFDRLATFFVVVSLKWLRLCHILIPLLEFPSPSLLSYLEGLRAIVRSIIFPFIYKNSMHYIIRTSRCWLYLWGSNLGDFSRGLRDCASLLRGSEDHMLLLLPNSFEKIYIEFDIDAENGILICSVSTFLVFYKT